MNFWRPHFLTPKFLKNPKKSNFLKEIILKNLALKIQKILC